LRCPSADADFPFRGERILGTSFSVNILTLLLLTLWAAAFFGAFLVFTPLDFGHVEFLRRTIPFAGFYPTGAFLSLHLIAVLLGLLVRRYARKREWRLAPRLYRLASVPVLLAAGEAAGFAILVLAVWAFD
jgi:hypothetical protein